jgi:SAM-dependent methyltransferase
MSATAPDGSPVGLYATLAPLGEPQLIHDAVPPGSEILELGCGAGRITHELLALGHAVVAVDNSPEMLAHVQGAETVLADIETLDLERRFPVVLLPSNLLNVTDERLRSALLATCARHAEPAGRVLLERMPPEWEPRSGTREAGGIRMTLRNPVREGDVVSATMEYEADGQLWKHSFQSRLLSDDEVDAALREAGLERVRWLDEQRAWLEARPS